MIKFELPLVPVAKARPRIGKWGAYTPAKTARFERAVRNVASRFAPSRPFSGAVSLTVTFVMKAPQRRVRDEPTSRPDIDNLVKSVADALNGMFWLDDAQITVLQAVKIYDWVDRRPRIELAIEQRGAPA